MEKVEEIGKNLDELRDFLEAFSNHRGMHTDKGG